jgi:hypothetical protein
LFDPVVKPEWRMIMTKTELLYGLPSDMHPAFYGVKWTHSEYGQKPEFSQYRATEIEKQNHADIYDFSDWYMDEIMDDFDF